MAEPEFEPKKAMVYFIHVATYGLLNRGGGALLSSTCAIIKSLNILEFIRKEVSISQLRVGIGAERIDQMGNEPDHSAKNIIPESASEIDENSALALVILINLSDRPNMQRPSVQYIPLATRSYTPGKYKVTEFFIGWNEVR